MSVGGDVSWTLGLYELSRAAALPSGLAVYVRGVETEERLDALAAEARRAADAFNELAELAEQRGLTLAAEAAEAERTISARMARALEHEETGR